MPVLYPLGTWNDWGGHFEMTGNTSSRHRKLEAERSRAAAENRPYAVPMASMLAWDTGAPLPVLLQTDYDTLLFFHLADDERNVGRVTFKGCHVTKFGAPDDETLSGHPLYGSGLEFYALMSVVNSPWITDVDFH